MYICTELYFVAQIQKLFNWQIALSGLKSNIKIKEQLNGAGFVVFNPDTRYNLFVVGLIVEHSLCVAVSTNVPTVIMSTVTSSCTKTTTTLCTVTTTSDAEGDDEATVTVYCLKQLN